MCSDTICYVMAWLSELWWHGTPCLAMVCYAAMHCVMVRYAVLHYAILRYTVLKQAIPVMLRQATISYDVIGYVRATP